MTSGSLRTAALRSMPRLGVQTKVKQFQVRRRNAKKPSLRLDALEVVKVNVGCRDLWLGGCVNVDLRRDASDFVSYCRTRPFGSGTVSTLRAYDLLEHFWTDETQSLLAEGARVVTSHGELLLSVPNLQVPGEILPRAEGQELEDALGSVYGGHSWGPEGVWDTRHWGWTPSSIRAELSRAGFEVVSIASGRNTGVVARESSDIVEGGGRP